MLKKGSPVLGDSRLEWVRDLTSEECDRTGFAGPLSLARREYRFVFGPWRPAGYYVIVHRTRGELLALRPKELSRLGIEP